MSQKIAFQGLLFLTGLMAGILLESRFLQARRTGAGVSRPIEAAQASVVPATAPAPVPASATSESPVEKTNLAKIHVDDPVFKFGEADTGGKIEHTFRIRNLGTDPLIIHRVQPACGCTTTSLAETQIEPGGSSELKAVLDLKGRMGAQSSVITIKTSDAAQSEFKLSLVGNVISRVTLEPASLDFGRVTTSNPATPRQIKIRTADGFSLKVLKVESSNEGIEAELQELEPSKSYSVNVKLSPSTGPGPLKGDWIKLLTHHLGAYREILVRVAGYVGSGGPIVAGDELEISGPVLGGGTIDLKSLRGSVVVVVVWASWCGHCQQEIPDLIALHEEFKSKGVAVLGVNSDTATDKAAAAVAKFKIPWANIHFPGDPEKPQPNPVMQKYQIGGIPATFVVDRSGHVKWIGLRKGALKARVEQILQSETAVGLK